MGERRHEGGGDLPAWIEHDHRILAERAEHMPDDIAQLA